MTSHPIPAAALAQHLAILGKVGSGKTYTAKTVVERLLDDGRRVCILDPTGVWWGLRVPGSGPAYPIIVFGGEHADVAITEASALPLADMIAAGTIPASIIDTSLFTMGERHRFGEAFFHELHRLNRAPLHLVIDECDEVAPQNPMPETRRLLHEIDRIVRRGRVKGFRVMMITQRPAVLHKNVLTQCNTLVAMRITAPQDRKAIEAWVQGQGDVVKGKKLLASLSSLKVGQGWIWAPDSDVLRLAKFPLLRTFDSSRAPEHGDAPVDTASMVLPVNLADIRARLGVTKPAKVEDHYAPMLGAAYEKGRTDGHADGYREGYAAGQEASTSQLAEIRTRFAAMITETMELLPPSFPRLVISHEERAERAKDWDAVEQMARDINARPSKRTPTKAPDGSNPAALKLLQVLVDRDPARWTWTQLATLGGIKARGGHFNTIRSYLRANHMVDEDGEYVRATETALALLYSPKKAPQTPEQLLAMWQERLPSPAPEMLASLGRAYPLRMSRERLAADIGKQPRGGHWNSGLANLRQNGLVEILDDGGLRLRPALFDSINGHHA